ncbi:unnamed protein product [Closterium sp. NIES-64]|nr:unnamed protein product [Closterium sp. NIES-64]
MQNRTLEKQGLDASSVYNLFLYREGRAWGGSSSEEEEKKSLCGTVPVLFIPGNAGCYKQVRSLASVSHHIYHASHAQHESRNSPPCFACSDEPDTEPLTPAKPAADSDGKKESGEARGEAAAGTWKGGRGSAAYPSRLVWFFVDLREHLSALHSALLHKQAAFVAAAVTQAAFVAAAVIQILSLYRFSCASTPTPPPPVLLVGHSMAGIVALAHRRLTGGGDVNEGGDGKDTWRGRGRTRRQLILSSPATVLPVSTPARPSSVLLCVLCFHARPPALCAASGALHGGDSRPPGPQETARGRSLFPLPLQPSMHALYHSLIQHTPNSPSSALLLASLAAGRSDWQVRLAGEIGLVPRVSLPLVALPSHTHTNPTLPSALPPPLCSSHRFLLAEEIGRSVHGRQKYPPPQIPPPIQHRHTLTTFEAPQKSFMGGSSTPSVHGRQQYPPPQIPPPCTFYSAQPLTCGSQQGTSRQCGATSPWLRCAVVCGGVWWYAVLCGGTQSCVVVVPVSACAVPQHIPSSVGLSAGHEQAVWCNQPVAQLAHALLSLVNPHTSQPFSSPNTRLAIISCHLSAPPLLLRPLLLGSPDRAASPASLHEPTSLSFHINLPIEAPSPHTAGGSSRALVLLSNVLPCDGMNLTLVISTQKGAGEESYGEDPLDIKTQEERRQGDDKRVKGEGQGEQEARKMGVRRDRMGVRRDRMDCGSKAGEVEGGFGEEEGSCGDGISPASQQVTGQPPQPSPLALVILPLPLPLLNSPCSLPLLAFPCLPSLPPSPSQYHRHHSRSQGRCPSRPLLPCSYCLWRWQTGVVLVV